jgi:putative transposase
VFNTVRKIGHKVARNMLTFAHYRFKEFIKYKAASLGKRVIDCSEAYTTKTVSWTGEMVDVGKAKQVKSEVDGQQMDRDYNGARGIFIKNLSLVVGGQIVPNIAPAGKVW